MLISINDSVFVYGKYCIFQHVTNNYSEQSCSAYDIKFQQKSKPKITAP